MFGFKFKKNDSTSNAEASNHTKTQNTLKSSDIPVHTVENGDIKSFKPGIDKGEHFQLEVDTPIVDQKESETTSLIKKLPLTHVTVKKGIDESTLIIRIKKSDDEVELLAINDHELTIRKDFGDAKKPFRIIGISDSILLNKEEMLYIVTRFSNIK